MRSKPHSSRAVAGLLFAVGLAIGVGVPAQSVQLVDGSILVGEIQDPDGEGFTLLRTDNGGVLKLKWTHLTKSSAKVHRDALGLLDTEDEIVTVPADVLRYRSSTGRIYEAIGRIVRDDDEALYVRKRGDTVPIRRADLLGLSKRQVTPFEIFTEEDYYTELLAQAAPGEDADKHLALGERLMQVRDYERAERHMLRSQELGGGRQERTLAVRLARVKLLKNSAAEQQLLDEIRKWTHRGDFKIVEKKIAEFDQKFAGSKLKGERDRVVKFYRQTRESKLTRDTARHWYKSVTYLAGRKASEADLSFAQAKRYAESEMGKDIRKRIAETLEIEIAEVEELWQKRSEVRGAVSGQHYYYSIGSWLLGPKSVLALTKQGEVEDKQANDKQTEQDKELQKGLKRIQDALRRQRQAEQRANRGTAEKKEVTPQDWWAQADRNQKATWIKACYGEFGGDLILTSAHVTPCSNCGGMGYRLSQGQIGRAQRQDCPVCHATRFTRDIRVK